MATNELTGSRLHRHGGGAGCRLVVCPPVSLWAMSERNPAGPEQREREKMMQPNMTFGTGQGGGESNGRGGAARQRIIDAADAEFEKNSAVMSRWGVSLLAWVNDALREAGQPLLSDAEWRELQGLPPEGTSAVDRAKWAIENSDRGRDGPGAQRDRVLCAAAESWAMACKTVVGRIASRVAWVNDSLREAGLPLLSAAEAARLK